MIGIFDSGSGGLTVLDAVCRRLPDRRFLYLGDHAHAPYGPRPPEEVAALTRDGVAALFDRGCTLVIVACNTASAIALRPLQEQWLDAHYPGRRLLGVFVPIIEALTGRTWDRNDGHIDPDPRFELAVFATPATVRSGAFGREIRRRLPNVTVREQGCPDLVDLIESGADASSIDASIARSLRDLKVRGGMVPDRFALGCTHYPLVRASFERALPAGAEILDQPAIVAESLARYLAGRSEDAKAAGPDDPQALLLTTGHPPTVGRVAARFMPDKARTLPLLAEGDAWRPA